MKSLSFTTRLFISNLVFAIPIFALTYLMYQSATKSIDSAQKEVLGDRYQRPLERVLFGVSMHKLASQRALNGDRVAKDRMAEYAKRTDSAFDELLKTDRDIGPDLEFTAEGLGKRKRDKFHAQAMLDLWKALRSSVEKMKPEESVAKHQELIAGIRMMIQHMGDTSELILDPNLDSYYLMDVTLIALPQTQDRIQDLIATVEPILHRGELSLEDRNRILVGAAMLREADLGRAKVSGETALVEDPNFFGSSPSLTAKFGPALVAYEKASLALIERLDAIAAGPNRPTVTAEQLVAVGEAALAESFKVWDVAVDELDVLLQARIDAISAERSRNLAIAGLIFLLVCAFSVYIGYTLRVSVGSILDSVRQLRELAVGTSEASTHLVEASHKVSAASTEQAGAIQETVATVNEIGAMVEKSVDNVNKSTQVARASNDVAAQGKQAVEEMIGAIDEINESNANIMEQIDRSNGRIAEIVKVIAEIGNKTKVINDIVFQTKLLSFNASVEAARAGEHGKGFAVVAEEVGNLAQMSGTAANEIAEMLQNSIHRVESIVVETKSTVEGLIATGRSKVQAGTEVAHRCGDVLEEVVRNVTEVNRMMAEIAMAQKEQAQGVSQISTTMEELDSATLQNADSAGQTAESAEQLAAQARELRRIVTSLEQEILGRRTATVATEEAETSSNVAPVIQLKRPVAQPKKQRTESSTQKPQSKKVSGDVGELPSESDPRFQDF